MKEKNRKLEGSLSDKNRLFEAAERDLLIDNFDDEDLLYLGTQPRPIRNEDVKDQQTLNFFDHVSWIHYKLDEVQNSRSKPLSLSKPPSPSEPTFCSEPPSPLKSPSPSEPSSFSGPPLPLILLSQGLTASKLPPLTAPIT